VSAWHGEYADHLTIIRICKNVEVLAKFQHCWFCVQFGRTIAFLLLYRILCYYAPMCADLVRRKCINLKPSRRQTCFNFLPVSINFQGPSPVQRLSGWKSKKSERAKVVGGLTHTCRGNKQVDATPDTRFPEWPCISICYITFGLCTSISIEGGQPYTAQPIPPSRQGSFSFGFAFIAARKLIKATNKWASNQRIDLAQNTPFWADDNGVIK